MSIVRWEPFRDLLTAQDRFNRIFNDTLGRAFQGLLRHGSRRRSSGQVPPCPNAPLVTV